LAGITLSRGLFMRQSDLNRAVARATGESVHIIDSIGFQHVTVPGPKRRPFQCYRRRHHRKRRALLQTA
jgi:hypothetical protein